MRRSEKIALLSTLINGQASPESIAKLKQKNEPWTFVVCNDGEPALTDLVDTRLPDQQGRTRVTYGEFLKNPLTYGQHCITLN